ncbi:MAG TPA: hypothetical protein VIH61_06845 [Waddliaceae bacterium]
MLAKLGRGTVGIVAGIFFIAYVCLLFPALVYMPISGLLAFASETMTGWGALLCVLGMLPVPLSMGASLYFISTSYSERKHFKVLFFCLLPFIVLFLCLSFMCLVIYLHDLWVD